MNNERGAVNSLAGYLVENENWFLTLKLACATLINVTYTCKAIRVMHEATGLFGEF